MKSPRTFGAFGKQRESKTSLRRTNFQWMQPFYEPGLWKAFWATRSILNVGEETALHRA